MIDLRGKKLLILAGASLHCKVVKAARDMGVHTIVTDYLPDSPAKLMADESWMLSITDVDAIVEKCKAEGVDGVLNFCIDPAQIPYQKITSRLGLPCCGTPEQFFVLTNKLAFKAFCRKYGLDTIPEYTEQDIREDRVQYPVFIKPADSRGSRGQSICYSKAETADAISFAKKESGRGEVVIEKFMGGKQDFSMTYFLCDGVTYLTRTCDRHMGRPEDNLSKQCIAAISPSRYSDFYMEKVDAKVRGVIKALGVRNGPVFMQGFIDGDTVRFYDPGFRFAGSQLELLLAQATGADLMSKMVEFALTGAFDSSSLRDDLYKLNGMLSVQLYITSRPGTIGKCVGLEKIKADPAVRSVFMRYEAGAEVPDSGDIRQRVCEIGLLIGPDESAKEVVSRIQSAFDVLDQDGASMLVSPLRLELLDD